MPLLIVLASFFYPFIFIPPQVHKGVIGMVKDELGRPIKGARISVKNRRKFVKTANDGDYWRLLLPGEYEITASANGYSSSTKKAKVEDAPATQVNFVLKRAGLQSVSTKEYDQMAHAGEKPGTGVIPGPLFRGGFPNDNPGNGVGFSNYNIPNQGGLGFDIGESNQGGVSAPGAGDGAVPSSHSFQDGPTGMSDEVENPVGHLENGLQSAPNVGVLPESRVEDGYIAEAQSEATLPKLDSLTGIDALGVSNRMGNIAENKPVSVGGNLDSMAMSSPFESNSRDYLDGQYSGKNVEIGMRRSRLNG